MGKPGADKKDRMEIALVASASIVICTRFSRSWKMDLFGGKRDEQEGVGGENLSRNGRNSKKLVVLM